MVNLFERNNEIGNKKNMFINFITYCDKININAFQYVPLTITISNSNNIDTETSVKNEADTISIETGNAKEIIQNTEKKENPDLICTSMHWGQEYNLDIMYEDDYEILEECPPLFFYVLLTVSLFA